LKKILIVLISLILISSITIGWLLLKEEKEERKNFIAIIRVEGYLYGGGVINAYQRAINYVRYNDSIVAVVIWIDSPGGSAAASEELYYNIRKLSKEKTVIASIGDLAASGGYFTALGAPIIYAEPTSLVGNVGVIGRAPSIVIPSEYMIETGPNKLIAYTLIDFPFILRQAFQNFLNAVNESRYGKLKVNLSEVATGRLFLGYEAYEIGLVDKLGSLGDALGEAAELAGVEEYEVIDVFRVLEEEDSIGVKLWRQGEKLSLEELKKMDPRPIGIYALSPYYIEDSFWEQYAPINETIKGELPKKGDVIFDMAHKNAYTPILLSEFMGRLVSKGYKPAFYSSDDDLKELLQGAKAFITIVPLASFDGDEIETLKDFAERGGKIIMFCDPSVLSYAACNSLSIEFGAYFSTSYLYNMEENFGVYRNIYVHFRNDTLFYNISEIVMFTASSISGNGKSIATTSNDTYDSITRMPSNYTVIFQNGNFLGVSDSTFILDPFLRVSNNSAFLDTVIKFISYKVETKQNRG